ncbi:MAG: HNH endonuclease [Ignavibacteriae bacterium]|nr:HNH endonuclease [Ignavibacteriota bacterium]
MTRCTRKSNLEIHHIRRDGGNDINNAQVLCQNCHSETGTYGTSGKTPLVFTPMIKQLALTRAGNQCQCTSIRGCH